MPRIGHASIDERGKISGGIAGDQTGKEVCIREWYKKPWNVMIVCNDKAIAKKASEYMMNICNDPDFGYDQGQRLTGYNEIVARGVSGARPSEFDCSSLVSSCYKLAGVNVNPGNTTRSIRENFKSIKVNGNNLFTIYTDNDHVNTDKFCEPGAIYLKEGSHVVMGIDYGSLATVMKEVNTIIENNIPQANKLSINKLSNAPTYSVGKTYTLQAEMKVRVDAGTDKKAKTHNELTSDGKLHDIDKDGALDVGTKVTCQAVKIISNDIWIKTPSGWIAAYYNNKIYVS